MESTGLQGRQVPAQGGALGSDATQHQALKGRQPRPSRACRPFRAAPCPRPVPRAPPLRGCSGLRPGLVPVAPFGAAQQPTYILDPHPLRIPMPCATTPCLRPPLVPVLPRGDAALRRSASTADVNWTARKAVREHVGNRGLTLTYDSAPVSSSAGVVLSDKLGKALLKRSTKAVGRMTLRTSVRSKRTLPRTRHSRSM